MATLLFQGHASCRITTRSGAVIYIDPFAGEGYDLPADLVLITHEHGDHNDLSKVTLKPDGVVIRSADALAGGQYHNFDAAGVHIQTVPAGNRNHDPKECVGYILTMDGITLYHAGDTSTMPHMSVLAPRKLDWVLLPVDGIYNMDPAEASTCAKRISGKHTIPITHRPQLSVQPHPGRPPLLLRQSASGARSEHRTLNFLLAARSGRPVSLLLWESCKIQVDLLYFSGENDRINLPHIPNL